MRNRSIVVLTIMSMLLAACSSAAPTAAPATPAPATLAPATATAAPATPTPAPATATAAPATPTPAPATPTAAPATDTPAPATPTAEPSITPEPSPTAPPPPCDPNNTQKDPVVDGVEANATITFWTFYLSPTFDPFIKCTIDRFQAAYPGVTVKWEDHQGTFEQDYKDAINAGTQPDVANLSNNAGWVREFAQAGKLLSLTDNAPKAILDQYFPNLLVNNIVAGKNYQFPWYQAIAVELINKKIFAAAGIDPATFPTKIADLPAFCKSIVDAKGPVCDIRLTVDDYLSQMVYEGNVSPISADGKKFTFDSPEAVKWLQLYQGLVKDGLVDHDALVTSNDRIALLLFSAGQAPFYQTGPQLIRVVKENNPDLYDNLALAPLPLGESGATQPDSQGISVKADTKFPNASMALAAFFSGPRAMLDFAKIVPIYPSTPASFDDPFFSSPGSLIEDSVRPLAKTIIANEKAIQPEIPHVKDVNELVKAAVEAALFSDPQADAQKVLTDAVTKANALLP